MASIDIFGIIQRRLIVPGNNSYDQQIGVEVIEVGPNYSEMMMSVLVR